MTKAERQLINSVHSVVKAFLVHTTENKIRRGDQAEHRPDVVFLHRVPHDEHSEGDEDQQRHTDLDDLQLR